MSSTFEKQIIIEKYIIKLKELSYSFNDLYIRNRFSLIIKYMSGEHIFNNIPLSETYISEINDSKKVPFLIKTDLYSELSYLDSLNQGGLLKTVKDLKQEYNLEVKKESELRHKMDEGEVIERNQKMLEEFIKEYGYNPINNSIISHPKFNDGFGDEIEDELIPTNNIVINTPSSTNNVQHTIDTNIDIDIDTTVHNENNIDQNGSIESLNQLCDIIKIDFNEIIEDINNKFDEMYNNLKQAALDDNNNNGTISTVKKKSRLTKADKKKIEEESLATLTKLQELEQKKVENEKIYKANKKIIEPLISIANKLYNKTISEIDTKQGIQAVLELAEYYKTGKVLIKSTIKSNLFYVFLIKKFNDPDAMYCIGEELLNGITILKNQKQGAKFIKYAADTHKHQKSINKLKSLVRTKILSKNMEDDVDD
jgi:hypothetical protein